VLYLSRINEYNYNYCNISAVILANVANNIYDRNDIWQIYGSTEYIKGVEMNWTEIYLKYKDTELMKDFCMHMMRYMTEVLGQYKIQGVWGYLLCFAETKGNCITMVTAWSDEETYTYSGRIVMREKDNIVGSKTCNTLEQAMLWCANKFFEVSK